ncbi:hypothetical protein RSSM_05237 [Rhodopirellula sallentina SM41]|uniref:Uncharacterized protein n=1 Tax=Rhodopirellula sallentina SM41 TaxID=1263870 RepID=M5TW56_9BACT|nr:hypothetical protein RSSM_05237 [Rhodopirellula sallentina SM41]
MESRCCHDHFRIGWLNLLSFAAMQPVYRFQLDAVKSLATVIGGPT